MRNETNKKYIIICISTFYKKEIMITSYFPSLFVPLVGIFLPGIAMATLFVYIEKESVD